MYLVTFQEFSFSPQHLRAFNCGRGPNRDFAITFQNTQAATLDVFSTNSTSAKYHLNRLGEMCDIFSGASCNTFKYSVGRKYKSSRVSRPIFFCIPWKIFIKFDDPHFGFTLR